MQLHLPCFQHRNHSEHDSSCHRDQQSDPNNNPVHVDGPRLPQSSRQAGSGDASQHECQEDSRNAACQRKEHTLHKKLKSHAPSRGTQGPPQRDLALPSCRPRQEQVGHIDASDQKQQRRRDQQDHQCRLYLTVPVLAQRLAREPPRAVARRILLPELLPDPIQIGLSLRQGHAEPQSPKYIGVPQSVAPIIAPVIRIKLRRVPEVHASRRRKTLRHHAHNRRRLLIQLHLLSDYVRVASEKPLPSGIAQHHGSRGMGHVVSRIEYPPQHRCCVEDIPESCIRSRTLHIDRQLLSRNEGALVEVKDCQTREAPVSRFTVIESRTRHQPPSRLPDNPCVVNCDDSLRLWIGQAPEQRRIHHREHRCRRRNPQCHRQHHDERDPRRTPHLPQRVVNVLPKTLELCRPPRLVCLFSDQRRVAECAAGRITRFFCRQPTFPPLFLFQFQIGKKLPLKVSIPFRSSFPIRPPSHLSSPERQATSRVPQLPPSASIATLRSQAVFCRVP